jgi:hypothetical protein
MTEIILHIPEETALLRDKVKLQWEVKPLSSLFTGTGMG